MEKIRGSIIILNGEAVDVEAYLPYADRNLVYEVIRMVDGKFIFLNDHLERLYNSFLKSGRKFSEIDSVKTSLQKLADTSKIYNGNIKLAVFELNDVFQIACFFVPHHYPSIEEYSTGVVTRVFEFERPDPTVKRWNEKFRTRVNQFIRAENVYEALLSNESKELTEGSRSNLFFIDQEDQLYTAPESLVLPGITRKYVLDICERNNIPLIEKTLTLDEAEKMKSCFITGTSPKVLQVRSINHITYEVAGTQMKRIIDEYNEMIFAQLQS
jgi:branched-chain amino acid aminotransferase